MLWPGDAVDSLPETMVWAVLYLAYHPETQTQIMEEIRINILDSNHGEVSGKHNVDTAVILCNAIDTHFRSTLQCACWTCYILCSISMSHYCTSAWNIWWCCDPLYAVHHAVYWSIHHGNSAPLNLRSRHRTTQGDGGKARIEITFIVSYLDLRNIDGNSLYILIYL